MTDRVGLYVALSLSLCTAFVISGDIPSAPPAYGASEYLQPSLPPPAYEAPGSTETGTEEQQNMAYQLGNKALGAAQYAGQKAAQAVQYVGEAVSSAYQGVKQVGHKAYEATSHAYQGAVTYSKKIMREQALNALNKLVPGFPQNLRDAKVGLEKVQNYIEKIMSALAIPETMAAWEYDAEIKRLEEKERELREEKSKLTAVEEVD